jgi:GNAT superfamily N-acetyltransferase
MSGQSLVPSAIDSKDPTAEPTDSIPELSTYVATEADEILSAHRLVADSVAQQRQLAARAIIFHPLWLGVMVAVIGVVYQMLYHDSSDLALIATTGAGCVMAGLTVVRLFTGGYIEHAEQVGTKAWLEDEGGDAQEQAILVTKFGEQIIGALIVTGVREGRKVHGVIRAWTVRQKYRGKGVGSGLLEEAIQLCQKRRWKGPEFDEEHANAKRVLPSVFNGPFERREKRARAALEKLVKKT